MNWVEGDPPSSDHLVQATRPNGPPVRPIVGEAGDMVAYSGEKGAIFLLTLDGLFLQTLGGDMRSTPPWRISEARQGMLIEGISFEDEQFHPSITQSEDGEIYMVVGKEHSSLVRLEGLQAVRRIEVGTVDIDANSLQAIPETLVERARQQGRETLTVEVAERPRLMDGRLETGRRKPPGWTSAVRRRPPLPCRAIGCLRPSALATRRLLVNGGGTTATCSRQAGRST